MEEKFYTKEELYQRLYPALKTKKNEMARQKLIVTENYIWQYFCQNVWNQKVDLTIGEMVDDILNTDSIEIYAKKGEFNENYRQ